MHTKDIKLTTEFKTQASKAVLSIVFFGLTYIVILACALGLTALCAYLGVMLIITIPRIMTILLGIGLASLGFFILIFLLKFLFASYKTDRSHLQEIKEEDEPELFSMIREIVGEVKTSFPKKIYLSADVNASVFYDSSFWSMFFPIKKNLQIGLALVNTVTRSELRAILAHEFGHFSQRTMKVGSYVYNVNKIIFNMLYENESYQKLVQSWGSVSGYFTIFLVVAVKIIDGIQWLLKKLYTVINKNYMALSREMEFHADEIAANVAGSEPLKSSLLRLGFADHSFNSVITYYNSKITNNIKSRNLFKEHLFAMNFQASYNNFPIKNDLPQVTSEELSKFNKSKLVIKDQWSSHPSTEDRIRRLDQLNIPSPNMEEGPANKIFRDIEMTQQKLTDKIFEQVKYEGDTNSPSLEDFQMEYEKQFLRDSFSKLYNGYYDDRSPAFFETSEHMIVPPTITVHELFSDENVGLVYEAIALKKDIEALKQISEGLIELKSFDYGGTKYEKKDSESLLPDLALSLERLDNRLLECDKLIYHYFKNKAQSTSHSVQLDDHYQAFFKSDKEFSERSEICTQLSNALQFINHTTPFAQIEANFRDIAPIEQQLKNLIPELLAGGIGEVDNPDEIKKNLDMYLSKSWNYFDGAAYKDENLTLLFSAIHNYNVLLWKGYLLLKKKLLNCQEEIELQSAGKNGVIG